MIRRSKLFIDFLKDRNDASQSAHKKQRNPCVTLLLKAKRFFFQNSNLKLINNNKIFWKSAKPNKIFQKFKPVFSNKMTVKEMLNLTENEEVLSTYTNITETL